MKILFICTHNRCRSIIAEAVANHLGEGLITAASAGSEPAGEIHPKTIAALAAHNIPTAGLASKSWDDLEDFEPDYVVTVCDNAAGEACPAWFGMSLRAHWSTADPSTVTGSEQEIQAAFALTVDLFIERINILVQLQKQNPERTAMLNTINSLSDHSDIA